ncbi:MAG: DUF6512 family protein [Candidatus Caldarchaeum sp.]|uniref:Uncharacterized protein n=1 Tax=Caldiarchaeum subterraneum TaxID=311458 RepID=A0A7C4I1N3_CALS0|nr:DUF6512 family protein [Candidatus Caldarchaeales archaeon]
MKRLRVLRLLELVFGIPFIVLAGSFLHFTYELSGRNIAVALFSAVNESVWEHLKLAFFPALFLALPTYILLRRDYPNFFLGKTVGMLTTPLTIVVGFYGYETLFHSSNIVYDIGLFIFAVILGQLVSYRLIQTNWDKRLNALPIAVLILFTVVFFLFTFQPPELELFKDPLTGGYGIGSHMH